MANQKSKVVPVKHTYIQLKFNRYSSFYQVIGIRRSGNLKKYKDLPFEMKTMKRFVGWHKGKRIDKDGNEIVTKLPYSIVTGESSCWNKEDNWATFDQAIKNTDLLGFVMKKEDGIVCIDLDDCYIDGSLRPFHKKVVEMFDGTYMEMSQSGEGIHIFMKGRDRKSVV